MTADHPYTTQLQAGLGMIPETNALLDLWKPRMEVSSLYRSALDTGNFPNISARRLRNIVVECFAPRYLQDSGTAAHYLKALKDDLSTAELVQLYFLYTCRANQILGDFVRSVYWGRYAGGADMVTKDDAIAFISRGIDDDKTAKRWSETTVIRVSRYLLGALADFGLLGAVSRHGRCINAFRIERVVSAYLAHDLHFKGLSDSRVLAHEDWKLFGLEPDDVRDELHRISLRGQIIVQSGASITRVSWKSQNMQEAVDVLAQG